MKTVVKLDEVLLLAWIKLQLSGNTRTRGKFSENLTFFFVGDDVAVATLPTGEIVTGSQDCSMKL